MSAFSAVYRVEWHAISTIADVNPSKKEGTQGLSDDDQVSFVEMASVSTRGTIDTPVLRPYSEVKNGYTYFEEGDVIIAKITPCMENGKASHVRGMPASVCFGSTEFHVLRADEAIILPRYLFYMVWCPDFRREAELNMSGNVGQRRVPTSFLESFEIPVVSLELQQQLVDRLDDVVERLHMTEDMLADVPDLLERFRQSVLASAFRGDLTAEWREQNPDVEPASELLERIRVERKRLWIEDYARKLADRARASAQKKNKAFTDEDWQAYYKKKLKAGEKKYEEPEPVDAEAEGLPELPPTWEWTTLKALAHHITSGSRGWGKYYSEEGPLFIRSQDINTDWLDISSVAHVQLPDNEDASRSQAVLGDVLVTITGANVGKAAYVHRALDEAYVSQHVCLIRMPCNEDLLLCQFLHYCLISKSQGRGQLDEAAYGGGKPGLNLDNIASVLVPLPPLSELSMIVERIHQLSEKAAALEELQSIAFTDLSKLRRSILASAFDVPEPTS